MIWKGRLPGGGGGEFLGDPKTGQTVGLTGCQARGTRGDQTNPALPWGPSLGWELAVPHRQKNDWDASEGLL